VTVKTGRPSKRGLGERSPPAVALQNGQEFTPVSLHAHERADGVFVDTANVCWSCVLNYSWDRGAPEMA